MGFDEFCCDFDFNGLSSSENTLTKKNYLNVCTQKFRENVLPIGLVGLSSSSVSGELCLVGSG